jgi:uncharacterized protein
MVLPDINVWIALAFKSHVHHAKANAWYERSADTCCFGRFTRLGFLRLAANPSDMKKEAVTLAEAWHMYDRILSDPRIAFADEPEGIEAHWRAFTQRKSYSPKVWGDAYLAAFGQAASLEVITLDKGFTEYKAVRSTILS